jgi:hypothetical protein
MAQRLAATMSIIGRWISSPEKIVRNRLRLLKLSALDQPLSF